MLISSAKTLMKNYNFFARRSASKLLYASSSVATQKPTIPLQTRCNIIRVLQGIGLTPPLPKDYPLQQLFVITHLNGLSNLSYKVQIEGSPISLVYKQYKHTFDMFVDRKTELKIVDYLSSKGLYPRVFFSNSKCRVQEYIQGKVLEDTELSEETLKQAVSLMAGLSKLVDESQEGRRSSDLPARQFVRMIANFKQIYKHIIQVQTNINETSIKIVEDMLSDKTVKAVQSILPKKMVMSHNDANLTNFILKNDNTVCLIDYEFACLNYVGFDLGNFFNEAATKYFSGGFEIKEEWEIDEELKKSLIDKYFCELNLQEEVNRVRAVQVGRLLSHYFWLFIGLKSFEDKDCDLDLNYYILRRNEEFYKYLHLLTSSSSSSSPAN